MDLKIQKVDGNMSKKVDMTVRDLFNKTSLNIRFEVFVNGKEVLIGYTKKLEKDDYIDILDNKDFVFRFGVTDGFVKKIYILVEITKKISQKEASNSLKEIRKSLIEIPKNIQEHLNNLEDYLKQQKELEDE